jgi:hypothetical protein
MLCSVLFDNMDKCLKCYVRLLLLLESLCGLFSLFQFLEFDVPYLDSFPALLKKRECSQNSQDDFVCMF